MNWVAVGINLAHRDQVSVVGPFPTEALAAQWIEINEPLFDLNWRTRELHAPDFMERRDYVSTDPRTGVTPQ